MRSQLRYRPKKNYTTHYNHFSQACQGHFYRQAGHSQGWARSLDPEKGNAAALVHIPLFTRSPVAVEQQLALLVQQIAKVVLVDGVINPRALHHVGHQPSIKQLVHVMVNRVPG